MATFDSYSFASFAAAEDLDAYVPGAGEVGGAWTRHPAYSGFAAVFTAAGRVRSAAGTSGTPTPIYFAGGTPGAADYTVQASLYVAGAPGSSDIAGVTARQDPAADTQYSFVYYGAVGGWGLFKHVAGAASQIGSTVAATLTVGATYAIALTVVGSSLTGTVNGVAVCSGTDTSITAAGRAGIFLEGANTDASGLQVAGFSAATPSVIPVTDPNWFFSPYNWYSDGSGSPQANNVLAGSTAARSSCPGAYFKLGFTGTSLALHVDTAPLSAASIPAASWPSLVYSVDDGPYQTVLISSGTPISVSGLAAGSHTLFAIFERGDEAYDRWNTPSNVVRITGLTLDAGATTVPPAGAIALRPGNMIAFGDSITEGIYAIGTTIPAGNDALADYIQALAAALNAEVGVIGYGGQAWMRAGAGNVPALPSAWNYYDATHPRLFSGALAPSPGWVVCNMGTNDGLNSLDPTAAAQAWLGAVRAAAPAARVALVVPFGGYVRGQLTTACNAYQATPDPLAKLIDPGTTFQIGLDQYLTASSRSLDYTHAQAGALLTRSIAAAFAGAGPAPPPAPVNQTFLPQYAPISVSAAGNNTLITGMPNKRIYVTSFLVVATSAVSLAWQSGASTALSGAMTVGGAGRPPQLVGEYSPAGLVATNVGDDLVLNLGADVAVAGSLTYFVA